MTIFDRTVPDQYRPSGVDTSVLDSLAEEPAQAGLSQTQIISILSAYWKQFVLITLGLTVLTAVVVKAMPRTYTAAATLIVNPGIRDPLSARQSPDDMLANYVATQTELMTAPVILLPVVERLRLTEDKEFAAGFPGGDINALREHVEKNLATALEVTQGRGGQLLYIAASSRDPTKAAAIANEVADAYLKEEQHRINSPAGERAQRYSSELAELRGKASAAQQNVIQFQLQHNITDLAATNSSTETQALDSLEQQLLTAQSTRRTLEAQKVGQEASTEEVMNSELVQELKTQLAKQQAQLAQSRTVLGPKHPNVLELESQIADTRQSLGTEVQAFAATTATQLTRAKDLEEKLTKAVADQRLKVMDLRRLQEEGSKLLLERDSAQAVYKHALDGYDQILFAAVGDNTNVSFLSPATPPSKPTKPAKKKLFLVGTLAAVLLGIAVPIGYELGFNRRLRCADDIERSFGIPVLAQFDPMPEPAHT